MEKSAETCRAIFSQPIVVPASLAICLNGLDLKGQWHFASGSRFCHPLIHIDFDGSSDAEPAWQGYQNGRFIGPPNA